MSNSGALNRRTFLKNAGLTAFVGAVGGGTPALATAVGGVLIAPDDKYDFDTVYNRVGTDCTKWDRQMEVFGKDNIQVGMGIADMDFKVAPCITKALTERIAHENYGYLTMPASHTKSVIDWNKRRYDLEVKPEWVVHGNSVHHLLIAALQAFSPPGSKIIVQSPTYNAFYTDINLVKCKAEENPLKLVNGRYAMDFEDLERRMDHDTHTLILCNPQNPTGNVWSRQDLETLGEICTRRRVVVLADEIHCDFVAKGQKYTPYESLQNDAIVRNSITFKSASKSFNLAATKCAYMFSRNPDYMARIRAAGYRADISTLGMVANRAAYTDGADWLDQVVPYIEGNMDFAESYIRANIPLIKFLKPQGTYLAWLDVSGLQEKIGAKALAAEANKNLGPTASRVTTETIVERYLVTHAKVHMNAGSSYGLGGEGRMRMNMATSRKLVELALSNIASALRKT